MYRTLACAALLLALAPTARAETFYVDGANPLAIDSGPGTSVTPYKTIRAAVKARAVAGNTIVVKPATYRETVTISTSGDATSRIVLQGDGPGVIVSGADDYSSSTLWSAVTSDVYLAASVTWPPGQVFLGGARLAASLAEPGALPARSYCFVPGAGLYVNAGGGNPGVQRCEVGRRTSAIVVTAGAYVTIDRMCPTQTEDRAIAVIAVIAGASNVVIQNCTVSFAHRYGMELKGATGVLIAGNTVRDNDDHGIHVASGSHGAVVRDNESFRNARPLSRAARGINVDGSTGVTVERNRCYDNQDSGFHYNNGANDALSRNNLSWNNGDHGFDHVRSIGVKHFNDVAWNNNKDGFSFEGGSSGAAVFNCIAANNGLTTGQFDLWVDALSTVGFTADHNLFWNSTATSLIKWGAAIFSTLAEYGAVSGQDRRSRQLDPRFVDPAAGDFRLRAGSPAIDAADASRVGWPATDCFGVARIDDPSTPNSGAGAPPFADLGACEFRPPLDRAPVVLAPETKAVFEGEPVTITVTASDPDGPAITSLTADLTGLPAGHGATFTTDAAKTTGTLRWTPAAGTARATPYAITFIAANTQSGTASTWLQVNTAAPPTTGNLCGNPSFETGIDGWKAYGTTTLHQVSGGAIGAYALELRSIGTATFGAGDKPNWVASVPAAGTRYRFAARVRSAAHQGTAKLRIREYLAGVAQAATVNSPVVVLTPSWQPLEVEFVASASGSTIELDIIDVPLAENEVFQIDDVQIAIVSGDGGSGPVNLCGNPGFERDTLGWVRYGPSTLVRVAGGRSGGYCTEIRALGAGTIGIEDEPPWITSVPGPGTKYRYSAWVRSESHRGVAKLQVREFIGTTLQGTAVLSTPVTLSPTWQQITADFTTLRTGSVIVMEVKDFPIASGEIFQVDDVSITRIGSEALPAERFSSAPTAPALSVPGFGVKLAGNPMRGSSALEFSLTMSGTVRVQIFDVRGREVLVPFERGFGAGRHRMPIGGGEASRLVPGAYFYRLSAPEGVKLGRFVVLE